VLAEEGWDSGVAADSSAGTEAVPSPLADSTAEADAPGSTTPAAPRRRPRTALITTVVCGIVVLPTVIALPLMSSESTEADNGQVEQSPYIFEPGRTYDCDVHREGGLLHAGHSDSVDAVLQQISTSWNVVEAQCLLEHRGYEVGVIDGAYGAATERAVKRFQDDAGLVADGIMGPHTWVELRS
jgi:hypothetical protein